MNVERYIITSAVNNSEVFEEGLKSLENYCFYNDAELIILPISYNPLKLSKDEIKFNPKLEKYIERNNFSIGNRVSVLPEVNIRPTAIKPLQGVKSMGLEHNMIIGHTRLHLEAIASLERNNSLQVVTTGAITKPNYTLSKIGAKAKFHHVHGAVIVEVSDDEFFMRQVVIDNEGTFYDLDVKYMPMGVFENQTAEVISYGDIHEYFMADVVRDKGFFGKDSLLKILKPKHIALHDLLDQYSESHHNLGQPFRNYIISENNLSIEKELESVKEFLDKIILEFDTIPVIVSSNHNSHLTQYLSRADWRQNPSKARMILEMTLLMLDEIDNRKDVDMKTPDVFRLMLLKEYGKNIIALDYNEPFEIMGYELSLHGDIGLNGSRSLAGLSNHINKKTISAHSHSPARVDGHIINGTSSKLDRNYTKGLSSHQHVHTIVHSNKKAQQITQNPLTGEFRMLSKSNSKNTFKTHLDNTSYENMVPVVSEEDAKKKYIITSDTGKVMYVDSRYELRDISELTEWGARRLIEDGERNGWICTLSDLDLN